MRIAVTVKSLQNDHQAIIGHYVHEIVSRLIQQHPEHTFIFLFDRPYDNAFIYGANVIPLIIKPSSRTFLLLKFWYDIKAPLALRRFKPDLWIQPGSALSLTTSVPQLLVIPDPGFRNRKKLWQQPGQWFYNRYMRTFLARAKAVITLSEATKDRLGENYPIAQEKNIQVIPAAATPFFQQLSWEEKEDIKAGFADNREYFLFIIDPYSAGNMMNLLKAFSLFKKWQHSNMKLLVAGRIAWKNADLVEKLKSYKYRDDIIMAGHQPEERLAKITAAAYALVYIPSSEASASPVIEAMQSAVPVIAADSPVLRETGGEAAVYADPSDPDAIAQLMIKMYRDETLRGNLIKAGEQQAAEYNWDRSAESFWQQILALASPGS